MVEGSRTSQRTIIVVSSKKGSITAVDALSSRASADAGSALLDTWRAGGADNQAGDLIAGAATLKYSIGYLRDFGP